ncbi:MAG TPA: SGNH/GDSL hydrolase family protein [Pseudonocardiaceae bacterium]|jgi:lysophospholipase L1-like esterase|nr:SGNH/GDSL hydrolase family protein [Pseudonocardiaceae bacterium]
MGYQRFVAIGDSCTEGLDDPYPDGGMYRGWADLVAGRLADQEPDLRYANLGVRGRRLDQIIDEQIPTASRLRPDLVALFGGGNDVLSGGFDPHVVRRRARIAVRALTACAPTVVVFTLSDLSGRVPMVRGLRGRLEVLNDAIRAAADDYGALLIDLWPDQAVKDLRYFGPDRLHLAEHGHRRLAARLLTQLGVPCDPDWGELTGVPTAFGPRSHAEWVCREVLPVAVDRLRNRLVGRSPGDGFRPKRPELLPVSAAVQTAAI